MFDGTVVDTTTSFKLTSNGNTIVETLVEDGVEMLTTYSDKDGELVVKHYCALGTEPMFVVGSLNDKSLNLISDSTPGYDPQQDNYVESMMWTLDTSDPTNYRVDTSINMDGQVNRQYSLFEKVEQLNKVYIKQVIVQIGGGMGFCVPPCKSSSIEFTNHLDMI